MLRPGRSPYQLATITPVLSHPLLHRLTHPGTRDWRCPHTWVYSCILLARHYLLRMPRPARRVTEPAYPSFTLVALEIMAALPAYRSAHRRRHHPYPAISRTLRRQLAVSIPIPIDPCSHSALVTVLDPSVDCCTEVWCDTGLCRHVTVGQPGSRSCPSCSGGGSLM